MSVVDAAQVVAAVATLLQTIVVIVAAIFGVHQLNESRRSRGVTAALDIFNRIHNREASQRRWRLYREIGPAYPDITHEQELVMQDVISDMYYLGYLVEEKLVEFRLVAGLYYGTAIRCWRACEPYIRDERARRGTKFAHYFEKFYLRCVEYMAEEHPDEYVAEIPPAGRQG